MSAPWEYWLLIFSKTFRSFSDIYRIYLKDKCSDAFTNKRKVILLKLALILQVIWLILYAASFVTLHVDMKPENNTTEGGALYDKQVSKGWSVQIYVTTHVSTITYERSELLIKTLIFRLLHSLAHNFIVYNLLRIEGSVPNIYSEESLCQFRKHPKGYLHCAHTRPVCDSVARQSCTCHDNVSCKF